MTRWINIVWFAFGLPEIGMPKGKRGFRNYLLGRIDAMQRDTEARIAAMVARQPEWDALYARALNKLRLRGRL